jgi:hypothetical protein
MWQDQAGVQETRYLLDSRLRDCVAIECRTQYYPYFQFLENRSR